jgi:hypothetical protein
LTGSGKGKLTAILEKEVLRAGGTDLCYLPIEFTDEAGLLLPAIEQKVTVSVTGAASLIGLGSALYKTDEGFQGISHDTYRGRALAVLKAGSRPGEAKITVSSTGMEPVMIKMEVK